MPPRTTKRKTTSARGVTPAQYREAERGLKLMLARKFSAVWIADNAADLLAQANIEYAEWLEDNPPARKPVGWLLTCAYRRALNLLDTETRKPAVAPLDSIFHLADESTPTPEEVALDNDRQHRLRSALSHLPKKEAMLLALVYYEGHSIREAGRKVGWRKSAADRHHTEAMKKMLALVGDRNLLSPATLGPAAYAYIHGDAARTFDMLSPALQPLLEGYASASDNAEATLHRLADLGRRLAGILEPANAAATGGVGRVAAQCGTAATVAVCSFIAAPAVEYGIDRFTDEPHRARSQPPSLPSRSLPRPPPAPTPPSRSTAPRRSDSPRATDQLRHERREERARAVSPPPRATGSQGSNEFGDNNFEPESSAAPAPETAPAPSAPPRADQSPASPSSASEFGL